MLRRLIIIAPSTVIDNTTVLRPFHMEEVRDLLWVVPESKIRTNEWKWQEGMLCGIHVKTTLGIITTEK